MSRSGATRLCASTRLEFSVGQQRGINYGTSQEEICIKIPKEYLNYNES